MAKYLINDKEVTKEEFNKEVFKVVEESPFFLDEIVLYPFPAENRNEKDILKQIRKREDFARDISQNMFKEELEDILKRNMNIGAPNYKINSDKAYDFKLPFSGTISHTGGTVFEKVQDTVINPYTVEGQMKLVKELAEKIKQEQNDKYNHDFKKDQQEKRGSIFTFDPENLLGKKESKTVEKAPVFTFCKQMKNAVEALALRSLYGHKKYEKGNDWENFSRVEDGEFEYSNAEFRHALGIGSDENEEEHLVAGAWNAVARLELYLRNKNK